MGRTYCFIDFNKGKPASAVEIRNCRSTAEALLHFTDGFRFLVSKTLLFRSFYKVSMLLSRIPYSQLKTKIFLLKLKKITIRIFFIKNRYGIPICLLQPLQRTFRFFKQEISSFFSEMTCLDPNPDFQSESADSIESGYPKHYSKVRYLSLVSTSSSLLL